MSRRQPEAAARRRAWRELVSGSGCPAAGNARDTDRLGPLIERMRPNRSERLSCQCAACRVKTLCRAPIHAGRARRIPKTLQTIADTGGN